MVKRSGSKSQGTGFAVDQLQTALARSLKKSVDDTVNSVCRSFQHVIEEQTAGRATDVSGGYDVYYKDCRRLVDYIQQTMEVSPGFADQMDGIILACHSGATERVLNSVVTKQLWFHRRGDAPPLLAKKERQMQKSSQRISSIDSSVSTKSAATNRGKKEVSDSPSRPLMRVATRTSTVLPATHTSSAAGRKRNTREIVDDAHPLKRRRRRAARKVVHDTLDEKEEKKEEEESMEPAKRRKPRKKLQEKEADDLLSFEDAIGELCYPDRRTKTETKFFKDRLRKSIQFVDALLCKPPQGKSCGRECRKIRSQICSSSAPCKNKMCRIWHDVEAHTDRCQNLQCEFKNRILLRETMHMLDMKERQVAAIMVALQSKQKELKEATDDDKDAVKNDIAGLQHELKDYGSELGMLEANKNKLWSNLNKIGIKVSDDVADHFPDFDKHYKDKKKPRQAVAATVTATCLSSASSRSLRAAARQSRARSRGDDDENEDAGKSVDGKSVDGKQHQRTVRRGTSSERQSAQSHHEGDEETKVLAVSGDEEMKVEDEEVHHYDPSGPPRRNEPPLPPAGPPPFRQNPEMNREHAVTGFGYSVRARADDFEAPVVAANVEPMREVKSLQ